MTVPDGRIVGSKGTDMRDTSLGMESVMGKRKRMALLLVLLAVATVLSVASPAMAAGAMQVSGQTSDADCDTPPAGYEAYTDYAFGIEGDLVGCIYGQITVARFHEGSGTYQEVANEVFTGYWNGVHGTVEMTENYTAKAGADNATGLYFARCKHPIVAGSGTGSLTGVTGRLDFKDDTDAGTADYTGHLRFGG
jgi:hypothetical protein